MKIEIQADFNKLIKGLDDLAKKQVPWTATQTLNRLGDKAREELKRDLKRTFTLRNQYTEGGIKRVNAQKSDWPFTSTEVGSISPYMGLQATGGVKRPKGSLPFGTPINARPSKMQIIPTAIRIPKIMKGVEAVMKRNFVPIRMTDGRNIVIQNVVSRGRKNRSRGGKSNPYMYRHKPHTGKRGWLRTVMYKIMPTVLVPKRWQIEKIVTDTVARNLNSEFKIAMEDALRTAK
jgi:hypothetical protein